ncbi:hypothetical protein [Holdemania massiliensis]|uniref:hypothetical protein n=1 Tax=Holdemania massiliensis TaxID=1468449 RepID=UPI001F06D5FC|nr:hypothetical protein [Holdemania massiliensis]MCH1939856.1 hypothetical protein [Holdemania massiliensis]
MKKYSITKYSRNNSIKEEWTSISDIGKIYNGCILDAKEYKKIEDSYVRAVLEIASYMGIEYFRIKDVFRWKDLRKDINENAVFKELYPQSMLKVYEEMTNETIVNKEELCDLVRLELREDIGGLLYVPYRLKIFIGDDYMMGVHTSIPLESIYKIISDLGLNIYQFI